MRRRGGGTVPCKALGIDLASGSVHAHRGVYALTMLTMPTIALFLVLTVASCAALSALSADVDISKLPPAAGKKGVTYDKDIRPIFEKSCFKCHGPEKQKGKLRLDSLAS